MHVFNTLPIFASLAAALTIKAPIQLQERQSAPQNVQIAEISYAGSGCAAGTQAGRNLTNAATFLVPQTVFTAESGRNSTPVVESRKNCQVLIKVNYTAGWQFSPASADYYGRVFLPLGVEATSKTTYYFSGDTNQISKQYYFDGPYNGIYFRNDRWVGDTGRIWSACGSGAMLNINSEVRVAPQIAVGPSRNASMEIYNILGGKVGVTWRKCT